MSNFDPDSLTLYTADQMRDIAAYTAYLTAGYDSEVARVIGALEGNANSEYQDNNGHTGVVFRFADLAVIACKEISEEWIRCKDFPGVVEYEIIEPMGSWFREHSKCTDDEFMDELRRMLKEWFDAYFSHAPESAQRFIV